MKASLLDVVAVYANPVRWESRLRLFKRFEEHMLDSGVRLTTVECAYGDRPWDLPDDLPINRVRVRAKTLVWNKENLINIGLTRLPEDWRHVAWIDADVEFRKESWAADTVHALQQYSIVQPWSDAYDLGPHDEHMASHRSFMRQWWHRSPVLPPKDNAAGKGFWAWTGGPYEFPHPGYAWAATRAAMDSLGGLIETGALGAGDHHMALALVGQVERSAPAGLAPSYMRHLRQWQDRAQRHVNGSMGFVWGTLEHGFHGRKPDRKYVDRWAILQRHAFDPDVDLKRNTWGVLELAGNKPELAHDLDLYFRQRNEDCNSLT